MEYRHGPISVAGPGTLVWLLGVATTALIADIENDRRDRARRNRLTRWQSW